MKIIQFIQRQQRRGAEICAIQLAEGLKAQGHDVQVVALFAPLQDLGYEGLINLKLDPSKSFWDIAAWQEK